MVSGIHFSRRCRLLNGRIFIRGNDSKANSWPLKSPFSEKKFQDQIGAMAVRLLLQT